MRQPPDLAFHLRMAALLVLAMALEHVAATHLPDWSSPRIGLIPFAVGLAWVGQAAYALHQAQAQRLRRLEADLEDLSLRVDDLTASRAPGRGPRRS